jgi:hypothetical protein
MDELSVGYSTLSQGFMGKSLIKLWKLDKLENCVSNGINERDGWLVATKTGVATGRWCQGLKRVSGPYR